MKGELSQLSNKVRDAEKIEEAEGGLPGHWTMVILSDHNYHMNCSGICNKERWQLLEKQS